MLVLHPDRMPPEERQRLLAMLAQSPVAAEPLRPWPLRALAMPVAVLVLAVAEALYDWPLSWMSVRPLAVGVALATALAAVGGAALALIVHVVRARQRVARAPTKLGKFLHGFGYVEAHPDHVLFVPGNTIERIEVEVGAPAATGASRITVHVQSGAFRGAVAFDGLDIEVPPERLDAILRARWDDPDSYRGGSAPFTAPDVAAPPRPRRRGALPILAGALGAAALAYALVLPEMALRALSAHVPDLQEIRAAFPLGWVETAVEAGIERRFAVVREGVDAHVREPFRGELLVLLDRAREGEGFLLLADDGQCRWDEDAAARIDRYVAEHSSGSRVDRFPRAAVAPYGGWHERIRARVLELASGDERTRLRLSTECTLRPTAVRWLEDGMAYALVEVDVTLRLQVDERPPVEVRDTLRRPFRPTAWAPYEQWMEWLWPAVQNRGDEVIGDPFGWI